MPLPALIVPLPANTFTNKLAPKVPNKIPRNPSFCSFASLWIVSPISFINKADSSRDLTIVMIYLTFSLEIINVAHFAGSLPVGNIFLWTAASVAAAAVNPDGIKTLLTNG